MGGQLGTGGHAPPPVHITHAQEVLNSMEQLTGILVDYNGPVNPVVAENIGAYRLVAANSKGSFTAKNAPVIKLQSAQYTDNSVSLTIGAPIVSAQPVRLTVDYVRGKKPVVISSGGVNSASVVAPASEGAITRGAVDALLERGQLTGGLRPFRT